MSHDDEPLLRSKRELRAARLAVEGMRAADSFEDYISAWQTFLDRLEKVWVKVERECQPHRPAFEPWQAAAKKLRRDDALLAYLHQARHADQHTIQPTAADVLGGFQVKIPPGHTIEMSIDKAAGTITLRGLTEAAVLLGPCRILLPFQNRGVVYTPPRSHLGASLDDPSPHMVAERGLAFYTAFVRQAEVKFFPYPTAVGNSIEHQGRA
jgi:hypothetical protein